ncbi:MAG: winged helix-turn-helix transcriptional regulator [Archaeoglobus sp.]|uniref:helix-turn-helix domain-containing protein n=1 Tax=Archaeoglobus sp. TaxID=1872626 RepID=UPI001DC6EABF|nr:helix-turn-helix domain-containing protein [Archaeoglobus sp.]MBO8180720.1 winged helix-turn-helix transcriptional regulator [Archaeoglobus sp.]
MEVSCSPNLKCVLKCALNISCLEMDIYLILLKNPGLDVETISKELEKDESTVYKALRNLMDRGLVRREYRILKGGGYKYLYYPRDFEEFKKIAREAMEEWFKNFDMMIRDIERVEKEEFASIAVVR